MEDNERARPPIINRVLDLQPALALARLVAAVSYFQTIPSSPVRDPHAA
jgi:hypothetical protein